MSAKRTGLQGRSEAGVIAFFLGLVAAVLVALLADGLVRVIALAALGVFGLHFLFGDLLLALADERATKRNPHDNRISDVGRKARVIEDFVQDRSGSRGKVALAGETWNATSREGTLYRRGDDVVVTAVRGLVLEVGSPPSGAKRPRRAS